MFNRNLNENIKLKNIVERLCDNLNNFNKEDIIYNNYITEMKNLFGEEPVALFDDSDIAKECGIKFEDLDDVIDVSSKEKKITKGYHVCESVILTEKEKQPISTYSKVYSCKSEGFKSKNNYTIESINSVIKVLNRQFTGVFDRVYDDNKIIDYMDKTNNYFVIRMNDRRIF